MFEIEAKVNKIMDKETVGAKSSPKRDVVFDIDLKSNYPKVLVITFWEKTMEQVEPLTTGQEVNLKFRAESREYNGRYFTNCTAISVAPIGDIPESPNSDLPPPLPPEDDADDMPF